MSYSLSRARRARDSRYRYRRRIIDILHVLCKYSTRGPLLNGTFLRSLLGHSTHTLFYDSTQQTQSNSVHFSFLDFTDEDDLQVTPVDPLFQPQAGIANGIEVFNSGKSVLFAVNHDTALDRKTKMILKITVKKRMPDCIKPDVLVGTSELNLSHEYAALRIETLQYWKKGITISKVFDNNLVLLHNGRASANIDVYVKISGYGQTIVTEFDAPMMRDPSTFIFGAGEIDRTLSYKCRKVDPYTVDLTKDSSKDLRDPKTCSICIPERQLCIPCEKLGAVQERDEKTYRREDKRKLRDTPSKDQIRCRSGERHSSELCGKPVVLKVSGLFDNGDNGKKPTVTVTDEAAARNLGDPTDPDYDIFVLRIGKKGLVGADEKSDIQLEMKTPKGPERRPPIRYETRDMQTELDKVEPPKEKKKKKKKNDHRRIALKMES
ncbi:hypothetical protein DMN91_010066 [Ooceraea biroi]|uniref:Uncharacterized protein n=2 Tax=Ooceraea biroi TaxID=2015173 RepID=A0A3L8DD25_OOCBI|nr:hypothetical protein DMN91_010066 [Ooceraea biroi]